MLVFRGAPFLVIAWPQVLIPVPYYILELPSPNTYHGPTTYRFSFFLQELHASPTLQLLCSLNPWLQFQCLEPQHKHSIQTRLNLYRIFSTNTLSRKQWHAHLALSLGCSNETSEPALYVHSLLLKTKLSLCYKNCDKWICYPSRWFHVLSVPSSASQPSYDTLLSKIQKYCPQTFLISQYHSPHFGTSFGSAQSKFHRLHPSIQSHLVMTFGKEIPYLRYTYIKFPTHLIRYYNYTRAAA